MMANVKHRYLKGKHKGVFNRKASKVYDVMILTESIIDAMSLIELGFENVQALYGTNGFTEEHLQILKRDLVKLIILAFDNDDAGIKAAEKLRERLLAEGFEVKVIFPPANAGNNGDGTACKDWNDFLVNWFGSAHHKQFDSAHHKSRDKSVIEKLIDSAEVHKPAEGTKPAFKVTREKSVYEFDFGDIVYHIFGVKEMFVSDLRVSVKAELREGEEKYYDTLNLFSGKSRSSYSMNLSRVFNFEPALIENELVEIVDYLVKERDRILHGDAEEITLSKEDEELGMRFLRSPDFRAELCEDLRILGYVGEELIKELMYYAATSRLMANPISVMIISQSASGKSMLIDTVKRLIPPEDVIWVTSLSDQALNYAEDLMGKFLVLGEAVHSEVIQHQIRDMLSSGELARFVTMKDKSSGEMVSRTKPKPARVAVGITGTRDDMNPENLSRFFMANMDESREQTRRIHEAQREKYSLERYHEKEERIPEIIRKHHAAQRLLRKRVIHNGFRSYLNFPDRQMRTRRDNERFIDLVAIVCFSRQYHKEEKVDKKGVEYIECDFTDYEIAYDIMVNGVLSSTLMDIPGSAMDFYESVRGFARESGKKNNLDANEVSFTQRDIREYTGFGHTWVKKNLKILIDYEYVVMARGGNAKSKGFYRLKEDEDMEKPDISMIPEPERIREIMEKGV